MYNYKLSYISEEEEHSFTGAYKKEQGCSSAGIRKIDRRVI